MDFVFFACLVFFYFSQCKLAFYQKEEKRPCALFLDEELVFCFPTSTTSTRHDDPSEYTHK